MKFGYNGFTLAEVLVTLGIIGVVSAMTIPTLMQNHQRKVYVTQLHKVYNELSQAIESYTASKNAISLKEARVTDATGIANFVSSQFKTVQVCDDKATPCFGSSYSTISGTAMNTDVFNPNSSNGYCFTAAGGYSICLAINGNLIQTYIDVNGAAPPNIAGRDFYVVGISTTQNLVDGFTVIFAIVLYEFTGQDVNSIDKSALREEYAKNCESNGLGCFDKILNDNWEMNY